MWNAVNEGSLLCCVGCDDRLPYKDNCFPSLSLTLGRYTSYFILQSHRITHKHTYMYEKTRVQKNVELMRTIVWRWALPYKDIECKHHRDSFRIVKYAIMLGARMCSLNTHCTRMHLAQGSLSTLSSPMLSFHSWWLTYAEFVRKTGNAEGDIEHIILFHS